MLKTRSDRLWLAARLPRLQDSEPPALMVAEDEAIYHTRRNRRP